MLVISFFFNFALIVSLIDVKFFGMPHLNPSFLKSFELTYEIKIRGIEPPSTVDEKRKILRGLLSQESSERSFFEVVDNYTYVESLGEIRDTLAEVTQLISNFDGAKNSDDFKRINTRLTHVSGRVQRLNSGIDETKTERQALYREILSLESDFADKLVPSTPDRTQSPVSVPIFKWGIKKFSGDGDLLKFLEHLNSLKSSRGCTDIDLFESAVDLFEADAFTWWYSNHTKGRFKNWHDLVSQLKNTFIQNNYDILKLTEIKSRKQKFRENVCIFITEMESQFGRLNSPPTEIEMVNIIRSNLLPDYVRALVLYDIDSIPMLLNLCKRIQDTLSLNTRSFHREMNYSVSQVNSDTICWNCDISGHMFNQCKIL